MILIENFCNPCRKQKSKEKLRANFLQICFKDLQYLRNMYSKGFLSLSH
eukprot:UN28142